ncbi:MAG: biotin carboxylase N-terminal domain-containing protein [Pseudomonadota bacterium]
MFDRVLIANRGEIACRIQRTCHRLGIETVAVYSDADADAQHVLMANEAVHIGPPAPGESYLQGERIIAAATKTGAQAIHPGYGFLSENAGFARACEAAGIVFIGPSPDTIDRMGSKAEAKRTVEAAEVPTVPGYHGEDQDDATLATEAERVGFPLMIKATAGGGGKGMRIVHAAEAFGEALAAARREAAGAFGDDRVLLERYVQEPRHVEVQVFGDHHGTVVHLFERDCSSQRRYQKVIEEAPAPGISAETRAALCEAAVRAAQAVGYVNAGTVEFIVSADGSFYFLEMNTRLQVEHPVTEAITGVDLVEWQLRIAGGEPLPPEARALTTSGHAIEARIYAEDPETGFLPSSGHTTWLSFPANARADTGLVEGDTVTVHYDPMIAKLIVYGRDRASALAAMRAALDRTIVRGPVTNVQFLRQLCDFDRLIDGTMETGLLDRALDDVLVPLTEPRADALLAGALLHLLDEEAASTSAQAHTNDPWSPWALTDGWRPGHAGRRVVSLRFRDAHYRIDAWGSEGRYRVQLPEAEAIEIEAVRRSNEDLRWRQANGWRSAVASSSGASLHVVVDGQQHAFVAENPFAHEETDAAAEGVVMAPMPGKIISIPAPPGTSVTEGQTVLVMEAMKMELALPAPRDGVIASVDVAEGEFVEADTPLVALEDL